MELRKKLKLELDQVRFVAHRIEEYSLLRLAMFQLLVMEIFQGW